MSISGNGYFILTLLGVCHETVNLFFPLTLHWECGRLSALSLCSWTISLLTAYSTVTCLHKCPWIGKYTVELLKKSRLPKYIQTLKWWSHIFVMLFLAGVSKVCLFNLPSIFGSTCSHPCFLPICTTDR